MSLHDISVFDKVYKWNPEKIAVLKVTSIKCFKSHSENMQVATRNTICYISHP